MKNIFLMFAIAGLFTSCAHYPDVRPGEKTNRVAVMGEDESAGYRNAMNQAKDYCDDARNGKKPIIVKENKEYKGSMDEDTYKTSKTTSKIVGGLAGVMGGKSERKAGRAVSGVDMGKPYEVTLIFKCK